MDSSIRSQDCLRWKLSRGRTGKSLTLERSEGTEASLLGRTIAAKW